MGYTMNIFRVLGDLSHLTSKFVLIVAIIRNRSAEGVSLLTQALYALVFCTRYLDLLWTNPFHSLWNTTFKVLYLLTSFFIIFLMMKVYARTREREAAWKIATWSLAGSVVASLVVPPLLAVIFRDEHKWGGFGNLLHDFSEVLEAVCILPQLLLLRQTTVPTVLDSFYLAFLFLYRIFYGLNWIWREADPTQLLKPDRVDVLCGSIQVLLYVDFAWVYYTRQRVKLRGGGLVDSEDFRRGVVIQRLFGKPGGDEEGDDEESAPALGPQESGIVGGNDRPNVGRNGSAQNNTWGKRGISVSADEGVLAHEGSRQNVAGSARDDQFRDDADAPDAKMADPDDLALGFEDEDSDDGVLPGRDTIAKKAGISGGEEWRG